MKTADVVVLGGGLIGLAVAAEATHRGASVILVGEKRMGEASPAGAGMLAPGAEGDGTAPNSVRDFAIAGRDLYPSFLRALHAETGIQVPIDRQGILELIDDEAPPRCPAGCEWVNARSLRELEPALGDFAGAILHTDDGAVDNLILLAAMDRRAESRRSIDVMRSAVRSVTVTTVRPRVVLDDGDLVEGGVLVIATGAWAAQLAGLPRPLPVRPVRGQLIMLEGALSRHVIYGGGGYLVPRRYADAPHPLERTIIGATMEEVGFDNDITPAGREALVAVARRVSPKSATASVASHWAGLRPMSPDGLPILGPDPDISTLLYACGHGRNGILLAPITGQVIGALAVGEQSDFDLSPFSISRFADLR